MTYAGANHIGVQGQDIWRLLIVHRTDLVYPDTVTTSYNEVRMQPSDEPGQAVLSSRMEIDPFEGVTTYHDYFGTRVSAFDVHRPHRHLTVTATSTVETFPTIGTAAWSAPSLGWAELEAADVADMWEEFLTATPLTELNDELTGLAEQIRAEAADPRQAGLQACALIKQKVKYERGATGVGTSAIEAWTAKRGVCQDFSHLVCALLRSIGIPARYVSGYLHPDPTAELGKAVIGESHSWVEWFDGSWTRFDPTNGLEPGQAHVVVGRGRDYQDVPPMKGVYAGPNASSNEVTVQVTRLR